MLAQSEMFEEHSLSWLFAVIDNMKGHWRYIMNHLKAGASKDLSLYTAYPLYT